MQRDFQKWHKLKSEIEKQERTVLFRAQEIWWCSLGANVGVETDGKSILFQRPVLVWRKFNRDMFFGLPVTSKIKNGRPFYFSISIHNQDYTVILSQLRVLSAKRLIRRVGKLSDHQFSRLERAMTTLFKKTSPALRRDSPVPNGIK